MGISKAQKLEGIHHWNDYWSLRRKSLGSSRCGPFDWTAKCLDLGLSFVLVRDDVPLCNHSRSCTSSSYATLREPALHQSWLPRFRRATKKDSLGVDNCGL